MNAKDFKYQMKKNRCYLFKTNKITATKKK